MRITLGKSTFPYVRENKAVAVATGKSIIDHRSSIIIIKPPQQQQQHPLRQPGIERRRQKQLLCTLSTSNGEYFIVRHSPVPPAVLYYTVLYLFTARHISHRFERTRTVPFSSRKGDLVCIVCVYIVTPKVRTCYQHQSLCRPSDITLPNLAPSCIPEEATRIPPYHHRTTNHQPPPSTTKQPCCIQ